MIIFNLWLSCYFFVHCRNVNERREESEAERRKGEGGEKKISDVSPSHSYPVQMQQNGAEPAYHCCWRSHTNTHKGTLLHTLTSHSLIIPHSQRLWISDQCWGMLPAGKHWVSPLSLLCALLSFFPCLSLLWLPFYGPSKFIYLSHSPLLLWNGQCFVRLGDFSNFSLSMPGT